MERIIVKNMSSLAQRMHDNAKGGDWAYAVLFYDDAIALMRSLVSYEDVSPYSLEIADPSFDGYNMEYYVVLDDDMMLWIETAASIQSNEYKGFYADVLYLDGGASYSIVKKNDYTDCKCYELSIDYDLEDEQPHEAHISFDDMLSYIETACRHKHNEDPVEAFIKRRFPAESNWKNENCYYFALILKDRFPGGYICYDVVNGHFSYYYDGHYYDHRGRFNPDGFIVKWDAFDEYDSIQKVRIVRDCLM